MSRKRAAVGSLVPNNMDAKHASLMQDYLQLQDDFVALKDQVNAARIRKATLLAEVRFLRRRLKKLKEAPSNLKENEAVYAIPQSTSYVRKSISGAVGSEPFTNNPMGSTKVPVTLEPPRTNGSDCSSQMKPFNENVGLASALKASVFRNKSSEFVTAIPEKRKISWKDQISLECK